MGNETKPDPKAEAVAKLRNSAERQAVLAKKLGVESYGEIKSAYDLFVEKFRALQREAAQFKINPDSKGAEIPGVLEGAISKRSLAQDFKGLQSLKGHLKEVGTKAIETYNKNLAEEKAYGIDKEKIHTEPHYVTPANAPASVTREVPAQETVVTKKNLNLRLEDIDKKVDEMGKVLAELGVEINGK